MKTKKDVQKPFIVTSNVEIEFFEKDDVSNYNNGKPFRIHKTPTDGNENAELQAITITAPCGEAQQFSRRDFKNLCLAGLAYLEKTE